MRPAWKHLLALGLYLAAGTLMFGVPVLGHMRGVYIGQDVSDPKLFMWSLVWWPHALAHATNPFLTNAIFAPTGANLSWGTAIPGLSFLAWPVTAVAGPVAAYNVLALLALPLAAWTAYLLCHDLTGSLWASVAGGLVYGFSTYEIGQFGSHMHAFFTCLPPLAVLLAVRYVRGRIRPVPFVALLALVLAGQFLISTEIFATMAILGAIAMVVAIGVARSARRRLLTTGGLIGMSYLLTALVVSPYLYFMTRGLAPKRSVDARGSTDLLNLVVPTKLTFLGHGMASSVASKFTGEAWAYFGIPLLLIVALFAVTGWRTVAGKLVTVVFLAAILLALGPRLKVGGRETIPLPWRLAKGLPLIREAMPVRLVLYGFLAAAVAMAMWLASGRLRPLRWGLALLALAALFPNLPSASPHTQVVRPAFFTTSIHSRVLSPDEVVLGVGPGAGWPMLWQAEAGMSFQIPGGNIGLRPGSFPDATIANALYIFPRPAGFSFPTFRRFLRSHRVRAIVLGPGGPTRQWTGFLRPLGVRPRAVGGVLVYRLGPTP